MKERSEKKAVSETMPTSITIEPKRGRGRPKGAKNKPKEFKLAVLQGPPRKRGRPPGAKNKPKEPTPQIELVKFKPSPEAEPPKKRGRPKKQVDVVPVELPVIQTDSLEAHPLFLAVKWLEKNMHHTEMQYYRTRASRNSTTLHCTMVSDILGFFNVQNADICKQIKKNNFIDRVCNS
jgi:hypothetical protein